MMARQPEYQRRPWVLKKAVGHMKNNSTDLLVFDMIIAPNIVPLEIYRRIAKPRRTRGNHCKRNL
jgi:hypothetical protein